VNTNQGAADEIMEGAILTVGETHNGKKVTYTAEIRSTDDIRAGKPAWAKAEGATVVAVKAAVKAIWNDEDTKNCPF
jgi:hypothetical protein